MTPRTGRPKVDNPKNIDLKIRIDGETNQKLIAIAKKEETTRAEIIRRGISLILDQKK